MSTVLPFTDLSFVDIDTLYGAGISNTSFLVKGYTETYTTYHTKHDGFISMVFAEVPHGANMFSVSAYNTAKPAQKTITVFTSGGIVLGTEYKIATGLTAPYTYNVVVNCPSLSSTETFTLSTSYLKTTTAPYVQTIKTGFNTFSIDGWSEAYTKYHTAKNGKITLTFKTIPLSSGTFSVSAINATNSAKRSTTTFTASAVTLNNPYTLVSGLSAPYTYNVIVVNNGLHKSEQFTIPVVYDKVTTSYNQVTKLGFSKQVNTTTLPLSNIKLSYYGGQDLDIGDDPTGPIKFSTFLGAVNYDPLVYAVYTPSQSTTVSATPVIFKDKRTGNYLVTPVAPLYLSNLPGFIVETKLSPDIGGNFIMLDAPISITMDNAPTRVTLYIGVSGDRKRVTNSGTVIPSTLMEAVSSVVAPRVISSNQATIDNLTKSFSYFLLPSKNGKGAIVEVLGRKSGRITTLVDTVNLSEADIAKLTPLSAKKSAAKRQEELALLVAPQLLTDKKLKAGTQTKILDPYLVSNTVTSILSTYSVSQLQALSTEQLSVILQDAGAASTYTAAGLVGVLQTFTVTGSATTYEAPLVTVVSDSTSNTHHTWNFKLQDFGISLGQTIVFYIGSTFNHFNLNISGPKYITNSLWGNFKTTLSAVNVPKLDFDL